MENPRYLKHEIAGCTACQATGLSLIINVATPCVIWYIAAAY